MYMWWPMKNVETTAFRPLYLFFEHHKETVVVSGLNSSLFCLASYMGQYVWVVKNHILLFKVFPFLPFTFFPAKSLLVLILLIPSFSYLE